MANRWCDGLGRYGGTKSYMLNGSSSQAWAQVDGNFTLSSANPRTGTHCLRMGNSSSLANISRRVFGAPLTEVFLGVAIYCHSLPTNENTTGIIGNSGQQGICLFSLRDQANETQASIWLGTDGALEAKLRSTVLDRSIPIIGSGAYQHIELYAKAGNSDGAIEIRVDEVTRLNLTGIDTVYTSNIEFSQWAFGHGQSGETAIIDFADFFCNDTTADGSGCDDFIGDCKSGVLMVNSDTAQADFDLSSGVLGYALLDETPPNDSDYISTEDTTAESHFGLGNGPANLTEILTVRPFDRAWKNDAGTCEIAPNMVSNAIKGTVASQPIATAPSYYDSNVPLDPNTGAPWTPAALDAALRAAERTA